MLIEKVFKKFSQLSVLVIGDLVLDRYLEGSVNRVSPEAPVPILELERERSTPGGAANVAMNLAALGLRPKLIGITGDDRYGKELKGLLSQNGVETNLISTQAGLKTITKTRVVAQNQQICRIDVEEACKSYRVDALQGEISKEAQSNDVVIVSDYAKGVVCQELIDTLLGVKRTRSIFLSIDPKPKNNVDFSGFNLATPNLKEAVELTQMVYRGTEKASLKSISDAIHKRYSIENLAITLSEDGILLSSPTSSSFRLFPTIQNDVADVSGAGDTVVAVLSLALAVNLDLESAARLANSAAGIVVSKRGTAVCGRQELINSIKNQNILF